MTLRRDHFRREYTLLVCPYHGHAQVDCCDREPIAITVVPVQYVHEVQAGRDSLNAEMRKLRETRDVALQIGDQTVFGSREAVSKVRAMFEHLKSKARTSLPDLMREAA